MRYKNHTTEKTQSNTYRIYNADGVHVGTIKKPRTTKTTPDSNATQPKEPKTTPNTPTEPHTEKT